MWCKIMGYTEAISLLPKVLILTNELKCINMVGGLYQNTILCL